VRKKQRELVERRPARFPFAVHCRACGWSIDYVKLRAVAEKLLQRGEEAMSIEPPY